MGACPDADQLGEHVAGELDTDEAQAIAVHLDDCDACRAVVVALVKASELDAIPSRYEIVRFVGRGGMGVVYAARDRELERDVAIKLMRAELGGERLAERLIRESRVLASIRHPAVVTVYDVGRHAGRVHVAMELVDGVTLGAWLAARPRTVRAIVGVIARAGEGFAAAHAAGVIHRDVKPDNILVGDNPEVGTDDPRVVVTDFGIARAIAGDDGATAVTVEDVATTDTIAADLTATGVAIGTPAYMAPEQLEAGEIDARADVFGLAVTLWEALYGARPYRGATARELREAMRRGAPEPPREGAAGPVPRWVRDALREAIAPGVGQRTATMTALVARLDARRRDRRRRIVLVSAGFAGVGVAAAAAVVGSRDAGTSPDRCAAGGALVDRVWTSDRATAIRTSFGNTATGFGVRAGTALVGEVGAWVDEWKLGRRAACLAAPEDRARREACLDRALATLDARAGVWATADLDLVLAIGGRALDLPSIEACASPPPRATPVPPALAVLEEQIARIDALERAGRHTEAVEMLERSLPEIERLDHPTLGTSAWMTVGVLRHNSGDFEPAMAAYHRAGAMAAAIGDATQTFRTLLARANAAHDAGDFRGALIAVEAAENVVALSQVDDPLASVPITRGSMLVSIGRYADGIAVLEVAIAKLEAQPDIERDASINLGLALGQLGYALHQSGTDMSRRALDVLDRSRAVLTRTFGEDHPEVAKIDAEIATALSHVGRYREAADRMRAAGAVLAAAYGREHVLVGITKINLGSVLNSGGEHEAARASLLEAKAILLPALGPDHPHLSPIETNLADAEVALGNFAAAETYARSALARHEAAGMTGGPLANSLHTVAEIMDKRGRPAAAIPLLERAIGELDGELHASSRVEALAFTAEVLVHAKRIADARARLAEAEKLAATLALDDDAGKDVRDALEKARREVP
jgi:serine/threonine protein kinase/tetratricopeptide (TPR) repeat protein